MEGISSTAPVSLPPEAANCDEVYVNQSILFSDSLQDLKNLRKQLYSAAEYFELSYTNDEQKDMVVNTLKEYAIKALVNTVDHLGSVSYKVNDLLDEKVDEVSVTELRVSCIEQRLRSCQEHIGREGLSQQSLVINIPKYHKRYILPVGDTMSVANGVNSTYRGCSLDDEDDWRQFKSSVRATIGGTPPSAVGKEYSPSPSPRLAQQNGSYSFSVTTHKKESEKQTVTPHRFPLLRSGSLSSRSTTPKKSRSTTPNPSRPFNRNPSSIEKQKPLEDQKSASMRFNAERIHQKDTERNHPSKGKRLLKALLSRRKSKQDDMLYTYLDEY